jgi:hypothetical protein
MMPLSRFFEDSSITSGITVTIRNQRNQRDVQGEEYQVNRGIEVGLYFQG